MGQVRETVREVVVPAGTTLRVWDAPISVPVQDLYIWATTGGAQLAAALDWEVFYGGGWTGSPFGENDRADVPASRHVGGVSQGSGTFAGAAELISRFHSDTVYMASNRIQPKPPQPFRKPGGFPLVVELDNSGGSDISIRITFLTKVISDRY